MNIQLIIKSVLRIGDTTKSFFLLDPMDKSVGSGLEVGKLTDPAKLDIFEA